MIYHSYGFGVYRLREERTVMQKLIQFSLSTTALALIAQQSFAVVGVGTPTGTAMPGGVGGAATLTALALVIGAQFIKRKNK
jgi:hypothetical protein